MHKDKKHALILYKQPYSFINFIDSANSSVAPKCSVTHQNGLIGRFVKHLTDLRYRVANYRESILPENRY